MTRCQSLLMPLVAGLLCATAWSAPARALEVDFVAGLHGATFLPWDAVEETGNGFGLTAGVNLGDWRLVMGLGGILPKSVGDGAFAVLWLETQWHPLQDALREYGFPIWPYLLAGFGVGLSDQYANDEERVPPEDAVRWVPGDAQVVNMGGIGLSVGDFHGFSVSVDVRVYNDVFGGLVVSANYAL